MPRNYTTLLRNVLWGSSHDLDENINNFRLAHFRPCQDLANFHHSDVLDIEGANAHRTGRRLYHKLYRIMITHVVRLQARHWCWCKTLEEKFFLILKTIKTLKLKNTLDWYGVFHRRWRKNDVEWHNYDSNTVYSYREWADRDYSSVSQIQISMSEGQLLAYMIFQTIQDISDILF